MREIEIADLLSSNRDLLSHSLRVFDMVRLVLPNLDFSREQERDVLCAALFHDIGKGFWLPNWHTKPLSALGTSTWAKMQMHPVMGANFLSTTGIDDNIIRLVREHHERPGGTGYPNKIDPCPEAVFLAACDVFSACTEKRIYRKEPLPKEKAIAEVAKFAPDEIVKAIITAVFSSEQQTSSQKHRIALRTSN
jgi:HD-GYP domain-containing protein (c-di-GMP phosphodiesterase class II)